MKQQPVVTTQSYAKVRHISLMFFFPITFYDELIKLDNAKLNRLCIKRDIIESTYL